MRATAQKFLKLFSSSLTAKLRFNALTQLSPDDYRTGKLLLKRIGAMLSKLCLQGV